MLFKKILIVDDSPSIVALLQRFLEASVKYEHTIFTATNGREALKLIEASHDEFDLIISDYNMPEIDGLELCREVKERGMVMPFILITGSALLEFPLGDRLIPDMVLQKPIKMGDIANIVSD